MPLQNRVDPFLVTCTQCKPEGLCWAIVANCTMRADKAIVRSWKSKAWVTCALEYGDIQRTIFSPDSYSELFFLDEATAFAAGHRPCGSCRNKRYRDFKIQ